MLKLESRGLYLPKMTAVALKKLDPFMLIARQKSECMNCICRKGYIYVCQTIESLDHTANISVVKITLFNCVRVSTVISL